MQKKKKKKKKEMADAQEGKDELAHYEDKCCTVCKSATAGIRITTAAGLTPVCKYCYAETHKPDIRALYCQSCGHLTNTCITTLTPHLVHAVCQKAECMAYLLSMQGDGHDSRIW